MLVALCDARSSPIHPHDIAVVAFRALLSEGHTEKHYALTGPVSLPQRDQIQLIGTALGKDLTWQELLPTRYVTP